MTGLQPWDLKLLDNGQPSKILFFRAFNGTGVKLEPPVEVILLIDEINLPFAEVAFVKEELARFLSQNGGRLAQPTTLMLMTDSGLKVQRVPSLNGNALLSTVRKIRGEIRTIDPAMGSEGALERFQRSIRQMETIAENEALKPGRKILVWIGPGWPMLNSIHFAPAAERDQQRYFRAIVELTNKLREARIVVNSVTGYDPSAGTPGLGWDIGHNSYGTQNFVYQTFLKGVASPQQARAGDLALKVLAMQTGGVILGPDNDLAGQIDRCITDADSFYQIVFSPAPAEHPDEYHSLQVEVNQPGLTVRTNSAYYDEPPGN